MKASVFKNLKTHIEDKELSEIIHEIRTGLVKDQIIALRQLLSEGKTEQYDEQKKLLLSFTPSGTFYRRRKLEFLNEYSSFIILDIDDLPASLLQQAAVQARECSYTYACFISPGGSGLKIIVHTNATPATHKSTFGALLRYYEDLLNVFIDESGKDIPRLCLYSFDPDAYINEDSQIFKP